MIQTNNSGRESLKEIKKREAAEKEVELKKQCEALAFAKYGEETIIKWSNKHRGLWYLPVIAEDNTIEAMAIMKPIDRHILSFASTKIEDEGLYTFLEQCMREVFIAGVEPGDKLSSTADESCIIADDEYFIPAAQKFNKIMEGKKVAFLKR